MLIVELTEKAVDAAEPRDKDYVIWDDELPGLRLFTSGKRSHVIQYRSRGRSCRSSFHDVWTAESAR